MTSLEKEWKQYIESYDCDNCFVNKKLSKVTNNNKVEIPIHIINSTKHYNLTISTKTRVLFLNCNINLDDIFWKIQVIPYSSPINGVIKKQMKITSHTLSDLNLYNEKKKNLLFYKEYIIKEINNPLSRTLQFKDERKITIGISKKDIMNDLKLKSAFYNCFALTLRILYKETFCEIHIKIFNTGKMEIPGIVDDELFIIVKNNIIQLLQQYINMSLSYLYNLHDTILINTNFNCGYYLDRILLFNILINSYNLECAYDPCTYPGIKIKYYFSNIIGCTEYQTGRVLEEDKTLKLKNLNENKKYSEISIMIFRTGSCLIVGNCTETIIYFVFDYIKLILQKEMMIIKLPNNDKKINKTKIRIKKRNISLSNQK